MVPPAPTAAPSTAESTATSPRVPSARRRRRPAPESEPLGSLLAAGPARRACPACGAEQLTELSMVLTDGTAVRFTSCRGCEHRVWESDDSTLSISEVLDRSRS